MIFLVSIIVVPLIALYIWNSTRVIEWRKSHLGFDPARHYYILAQETILSKDKDTGSIGSTISFLRAAFSWDNSYVEKAQKDPLFSHLQEYENFRAIVEKYKHNEGESKNPSKRRK